MTPQEVLLKAADDFSTGKVGWRRNRYGTTHAGQASYLHGGLIDRMKDPILTCFCSVGAIYRVAPDTKTAEAAVNLMSMEIELETRPGEGDVLTWNDARWRTVEQVIDAMRKAAA